MSVTEIIYALINFAILAGLILILGRKKIAALLGSHRDKVREDLQRSEDERALARSLPEDLEQIRAEEARREEELLDETRRRMAENRREAALRRDEAAEEVLTEAAAEEEQLRSRRSETVSRPFTEPE